MSVWMLIVVVVLSDPYYGNSRCAAVAKEANIFFNGNKVSLACEPLSCLEEDTIISIAQVQYLRGQPIPGQNNCAPITQTFILNPESTFLESFFSLCAGRSNCSFENVTLQAGNDGTWYAAVKYTCVKADDVISMCSESKSQATTEAYITYLPDQHSTSQTVNGQTGLTRTVNGTGGTCACRVYGTTLAAPVTSFNCRGESEQRCSASLNMFGHNYSCSRDQTYFENVTVNKNNKRIELLLEENSLPWLWISLYGPNLTINCSEFVSDKTTTIAATTQSMGISTSTHPGLPSIVPSSTMTSSASTLTSTHKAFRSSSPTLSGTSRTIGQSPNTQNTIASGSSSEAIIPVAVVAGGLVGGAVVVVVVVVILVTVWCRRRNASKRENTYSQSLPAPDASKRPASLIVCVNQSYEPSFGVSSGNNSSKKIDEKEITSVQTPSTDVEYAQVHKPRKNQEITDGGYSLAKPIFDEPTNFKTEANVPEYSYAEVNKAVGDSTPELTNPSSSANQKGKEHIFGLSDKEDYYSHVDGGPKSRNRQAVNKATHASGDGNDYYHVASNTAGKMTSNNDVTNNEYSHLVVAGMSFAHEPYDNTDFGGDYSHTNLHLKGFNQSRYNADDEYSHTKL